MICWIRGWWLTIKTGVWMYGDRVSGHICREELSGKIRCMTCGFSPDEAE